MKSLPIAVAFAVVALRSGAAEPPELASWIRNGASETGYGGLPANIQRVRYSDGSVYVNASCIPSYSIGPWGDGNPNVPTDQQFLLRFPRSPRQATAPTATPLGPIGSWVNGVAIFNAQDARSFENENVWHQNAVVVEASGFDSCLGHTAPGGVYHHHQNPVCLGTGDSSGHSAIVGWAFDGFPIYGPFGYADADGSGGVRRVTPSYRLRNIAQRTSLPDGTVLSSSQYGPAVSSSYPLGYYVEDFEYVDGLSDLDASNGRFTVTPEYPDGTYAYFVGTDSSGASAYPYAIGPKYHGVLAEDDVSTHGHVTVGEPTADYTGASSVELLTGCCGVVVPAAASAAGVGNSRWTTRLELSNDGSEAVTIGLHFLRRDADGSSAARVDFVLPGGASAGLDDVVADTFGAAGASGAILVDSDSSAVRVTSRTSNSGSACGGTFGQGIPSIAKGDLFASGETAYLAPILGASAGSRTNLGIANASGGEAAVSVTILDAAGTALVTRSITLPSWSSTQVTDLTSAWSVGSARRARISTASAGAKLAAYLSVVDATSGDPAYFAATK